MVLPDSRGLRNELSKVEVGAAVAIGIPLLLLNPIVLPHLLTLVAHLPAKWLCDAWH